MKFYKSNITAMAVVFSVWLVIAAAACGDNLPTLKEAFAEKFLIGGALNDAVVSGKDPSAAAIAQQQFNTITAENAMKWEAIHPQPDKYDFEAADRFVDFGLKNKMFIIGHTLVWHNQTPSWVFEGQDGRPASRDELLARMKEHIFTVVGRYKGKIHGWDVVNEAVEDDGSLRQTKWLTIIGPDYLEKAFEYAHQADPNAELYYNDYNMWKTGKREGVLRVVGELKSKGLRVDGIGIQGHWGLDYPPLNEAQDSIVAYASLGVKVMITELDVTVLPSASSSQNADIAQNFQLRKELDPYPDGLPDPMQQKLAHRYGEIFHLFVQHADKISRVTFWGVHDGCSWRNNWPVRGRTDYPLLFDRNCNSKPAFDAVIKTVQNEAR